MTLKSYFLFPILIFLMAVTACGGGSGESKPEVSVTLSPKQAGLKCFAEGDAACAADRYCSVQDDAEAAFRCCVATFLNVYFSDNTRALGISLGYDPIGLKEAREMSRQDLLSERALPFAELLLSQPREGKKYSALIVRWLQQLSQDQAAAAELNDRLIKFGAGLETAYQCLDSRLTNFERDQINPEIWSTKEGLPITLRDLLFTKFFLGTVSYVLQTLPQYEWGFDYFPAAALEEGFLADINGQAGEGDIRFGDLGQGRVGQIVAKFPLLKSSFADLKRFSQLPQDATLIDAYLNWRFERGDQDYLAGILRSVYQSLQEDVWQDIPGEDWQLNFFSLSQAARVPDGRKVDRSMEVLHQEEGALKFQGDFLREWALPILKENTQE